MDLMWLISQAGQRENWRQTDWKWRFFGFANGMDFGDLDSWMYYLKSFFYGNMQTSKTFA